MPQPLLVLEINNLYFYNKFSIMNKALIVAGIALLSASALTSCKKTYKCSCTTTTKVNGKTTNVSTVTQEKKTTQTKAKNWCSDWTNSSVSGADTTASSTDCTIL